MHESLKHYTFGHDVAESPAATLAAVEAAATRIETPCGDGHMVWRRWGSGPPVILLHGGGGSWSHWLRNIDALSQRHTLYAADMPGFGDSALPAQQSIDAFLMTIEEGWRVIHPQSDPVSIVGFSLGAAIGVAIGARLQDRLSNLILVGPRLTSFTGSADLPMVSWRKLEDPAQRVAAHRRNLELLMLANPANIDPMAVHLQAINAERMRVAIRRWKPGARDRQQEYFPQLKPRTSFTLIYGREDQGAGPIFENQGADLKTVHRSIRLHFIEGAGHWVQYEAAERFNAIALDALSHTA